MLYAVELIWPPRFGKIVSLFRLLYPAQVVESECSSTLFWRHSLSCVCWSRNHTTVRSASFHCVLFSDGKSRREPLITQNVTQANASRMRNGKGKRTMCAQWLKNKSHRHLIRLTTAPSQSMNKNKVERTGKQLESGIKKLVRNKNENPNNTSEYNDSGGEHRSKNSAHENDYCDAQPQFHRATNGRK